MLILLASLPAAAQTRADTMEAWLVSYGPGEIYWQRFGHNAIWIRESGQGLDHAFNFGFFDFGQEDFFLRFLQGRMLYFSAARPVREEFAAYINENRSIRAQKLDLSPEQKFRLAEYLLAEVRPENRDYLYDYYLNNCSTRVRDAIDLALDGALRNEFEPILAAQTWRDHTRRLTGQDFWLYLGLETGLGAPVDRDISRWDEMFIPAMLADALAGFEYQHAGGARSLVLEDVMLYQSTLEPPAAAPRAWWPRYLLASLATLLAAGLLCRLAKPSLAVVLARSWLVISGIIGAALLFFWLGTDHSVARLNLNLLVFNPLWLLLAVWKGRERAALLFVTALSLLSLLMTALPPGQYNLDVLAAFLPLNLLAAFVLYHRASTVAPGRDPVRDSPQ